MEYRIKIEERNDGVKNYTPQVMGGKIVGGWMSKRFYIYWDNIVGYNCSSLSTSSTKREIYDSEEDALEVIKRYKEELLLEETKKINKVSYKKID